MTIPADQGRNADGRMPDTVSRIGLLGTIVAVIITRAGSKLAVLFSFLMLGWALGPETFGHYAVISVSFFIAFQFANFGLRQAGAHFIGQSPRCENTVMRAMALFFPVALLAFVLMVWALISLSETVPIPVGWLTITVPIVLAGLGAVTLSFTQGINLGRGQIGVFNLSGIVHQISAALVVLLFVGLSLVGMLRFDLSLAVWSLVIGFLSGGAFGLFRVFPAAPRQVDDPSSLRMLGALLRYGWFYALVLLLLTINSRMAIFFLAASDPADAGQYFLAQRLSEAFLEISSAVGLVLFSLGARSKDPVEMLCKSAALTRGLIVMALISGAVLVLIVPELVRRLFAQQDTIGLLPILLLVATLPFTAFNRTIYQALAGIGQPKIGGISYGGAVLLNASIAYVLTPQFGISGAVSGFLAGQIFVTVVLLTFIRIRYELPAGMFLVPRTSDFVQLRGAGLRLLRRVRK